MIDGTEKPEIPLKFAKRSRDTKNLAISRDFLGYSKLIFLFFVLYHFMLSGNFYCGSEIRNGIFWGINFGPVMFLFFFWSPRDFFGFGFCPPCDYPCHLKSGVPPLGWVKLKRTLNFSHFPSQVTLYLSDWKLCGGEQWKNQTFFRP